MQSVVGSFVMLQVISQGGRLGAAAASWHRTISATGQRAHQTSMQADRKCCCPSRSCGPGWLLLECVLFAHVCASPQRACGEGRGVQGWGTAAGPCCDVVARQGQQVSCGQRFGFCGQHTVVSGLPAVVPCFLQIICRSQVIRQLGWYVDRRQPGLVPVRVVLCGHAPWSAALHAVCMPLYAQAHKAAAGLRRRTLGCRVFSWAWSAGSLPCSWWGLQWCHH